MDIDEVQRHGNAFVKGGVNFSYVAHTLHLALKICPACRDLASPEDNILPYHFKKSCRLLVVFSCLRRKYFVQSF